MSTSSSSSTASSDAADRWWDLYPNSGGAATLLVRCIRTHGWTYAHARKVLEGYRAFLEVKMFLKDWDAKLLSPSIPVDQVWHLHILDNRNYAKDCELLCGHVVYHDPDGMIDKEARDRRVETTQILLESRIGELDEEIWSFGSVGSSRKRLRAEGEAKKEDALGEGESNVKGGNEESVWNAPTDSETEEEAKKEDSSCDEDDHPSSSPTEVTIRIRESGAEMKYRIDLAMTMERVFEAYARMRETSTSRLRFLFDGERFYDETATARHYELKDGDVIDCVPEQGGC